MQYEKPHGINMKYIDLIVDGGNIVKSKKIAIMTKKVFKANKDRSEKAEREWTNCSRDYIIPHIRYF
jgi:hypothetical protein